MQDHCSLNHKEREASKKFDLLLGQLMHNIGIVEGLMLIAIAKRQGEESKLSFEDGELTTFPAVYTKPYFGELVEEMKKVFSLELQSEPRFLDDLKHLADTRVKLAHGFMFSTKPNPKFTMLIKRGKLKDGKIKMDVVRAEELFNWLNESMCRAERVKVNISKL